MAGVSKHAPKHLCVLRDGAARLLSMTPSQIR